MADNQHKIKQFYSKKYGVLIASQLDSNNYHGTSGIQIDYDCKPSTVINIRKYLSECTNYSSAIMNPLISNLNTAVTHATAATDEYKQKLLTFQNSVVWLWGSLLQGGVFLFKMDNQYYIGEITGHYTNETQERFYETHVPAEDTERMEQIAFNWVYYGGNYNTGGSYTANNIELTCIANTTNGFTTRTATLIDLATWSYPQSTETTEHNLQNCLSNRGFTTTALNITTYTPYTLITSGLSRFGGYWFVDSETFVLSGFEHDYGEWYGDVLKEQPDIGDGTAENDGGSDGFDNDTDREPVTPDSQFTVDGINSGMITLYNPTSAEVQDFCNFLFAGITENMSAVLKRLVVSPLEYVISLNMCHFHPTIGSSERIKFCGIDSGVTAFKITKQFHKIDCGTINIDQQFYGFLDYGGFSNAKIYLPYCGIYPLNIDEIMGGSVHVVYWIDLMSGSCVAQVEINNSNKSNLINTAVLYEFTGNCFEGMPLSATDYRGTISGLMSVVSGAAALAMGNAAGVGAMASGVLSMKPDVIHGGNMSTSFGYMGKQVPYMILERPVKKPPLDFPYMRGYPSNITCLVSELKRSGYCEIDINTLDIKNVPGITITEQEELQKYLSEGVFF